MLNRHLNGEQKRGQIMVLFALVLVVILLFAAMAVDLGMQMNDRQTLVNAMDAAALAGGTQMPVDGDTPGAYAANQQLINDTVIANYPSIAPSDYTILYRCLIGVDSSNQPYLSRDVPTVCNPGGALGHAPTAADFTGSGPTRSAPCDPTLQFNGHYDKCNVVLVQGIVTTEYALAPAVGFLNGRSGAQAAACNGACGAAPAAPVDVVLVMDRTGSMSAQDIADIQTGANTLLSVFNPSLQRVALGTIGPSTPGLSACPNNSTSPFKGTPVYGVGQSPSNNINFFSPADLDKWIPVGFSGTDPASPAVTFNEAYSANGVTNTNSTIWKAISCLYSYTSGTNLDTPMARAQEYLNTFGRPGVKKAIIFETDGTPQAGDGSAHYTCNAADNTATTAKAAPNDIEVFTIGFGIDAATCPSTTNQSGCTGTNVNETPAWSCDPIASLLSSMATDPSHFYNAPTSAALIAAFSAAANQLVGGGTHLVQLYPTPIVTSVSPASGPMTGGTVVTISGEFLTGATSVRFAGTAATSVTVISDTTIQATAPAGASNATVNVVVRTGGGVSIASPTGAADDFTYGP